jgi:hypothetical protein
VPRRRRQIWGGRIGPSSIRAFDGCHIAADQNGTTAGPPPGFHVFETITDHPGRVEVDAVLIRSAVQQAGLRLATGAFDGIGSDGAVRMMRTVEEPCQAHAFSVEQFAQPLLHRPQG